MTTLDIDQRPWYLYVVQCSDDSFYTGITTDLDRRVSEHNAGRGARYTASRCPVTVRACWRFPNQRAAMQAEITFKRQGRSGKVRAINKAGMYREGSWTLDKDQ